MKCLCSLTVWGAIVKVRIVKPRVLDEGRPVAPGDELDLPDRAAKGLVESGDAVRVSVRVPVPATKSEKGD